MKMSQFRIQNYRSITDSGWIKTEDISVIVGKNEAGKTSLLKALWKFNPFNPEPYSLDREWPRGRRKEKSPEKIVAEVQFEFTQEELKKIHSIDESCKHVSGVLITKKYDGSKTYSFLPTQISTHSWLTRLLRSHLKGIAAPISPAFRTNLTSALQKSADEVTNSSSLEKFKQDFNKIRDGLSGLVAIDGSKEEDVSHIPALVAHLNNFLKEITIAPVTAAIKISDDSTPKFIYMDDHKVFSGTAFLNQIKERKDQGKLSEDDKTTILIMEMAGLNLDEEVKKASVNDREQRVLDMNDASQTLTSDISNRWSQKKYEVMFQADGNHFMTFVKDDGGSALVPLEERSKGFQWFFSFDMTFMYESSGSFENSIILLDEPGLHLHPDAQKDLLERFKAYSRNNQLIYSTHLPFMIDCKRLDNVWVAEEKPVIGVKVHQDWDTADKDARFTLQAALGLSWSQSLFIGQYNLVVEGATDYWFMNTVSEILKTAGREGLDKSLVVTYAGGASKVAYMGTLLKGQQLNVAVLLDSDKEGRSAFQQLTHQKILDQKHVLLLGTVIGKDKKDDCILEDFFPEDYYLGHVKEAYREELGGRALLIKNDKRPVVERVDEALSKEGIIFNKGRVGLKIKEDFSSLSYEKLPDGVGENFEKLFNSLNALVSKWKNSNVKSEGDVKTKKESSLNEVQLQ